MLESNLLNRETRLPNVDLKMTGQMPELILKCGSIGWEEKGGAVMGMLGLQRQGFVKP